MAKQRAATSSTSRTSASSSPITLAIKDVERASGHEYVLDIEIRPGDATRLKIVNQFLQDRPLFEKAMNTPATNAMRDVRIASDRPIFLFLGASGELGRVQVDLGAARPRVIGTATGNVTLR